MICLSLSTAKFETSYNHRADWFGHSTWPFIEMHYSKRINGPNEIEIVSPDSRLECHLTCMLYSVEYSEGMELTIIPLCLNFDAADINLCIYSWRRDNSHLMHLMQHWHWNLNSPKLCQLQFPFQIFRHNSEN